MFLSLRDIRPDVADVICFIYLFYLFDIVLSAQVKAQLGEASDLLTKQVPEASSRVGQGTADALKGAASNTDVGNPVKEALGSLEQVGCALALKCSR